MLGQPPPLTPAVTDKQKAELFCQAYARVSRLPKDKQRDQARSEGSKNCCGGAGLGFCSPFSPRELQQATCKLKTGRSPGVDGVTNDMLRQLSPTAKKELLKMANRSWSEGDVPSTWRMAEIVAIPKKGKSLTETGSYRLISLLSCISKLVERLVQHRLQAWRVDLPSDAIIRFRVV